jgi:hypothetical protein
VIEDAKADDLMLKMDKNDELASAALGFKSMDISSISR